MNTHRHDPYAHYYEEPEPRPRPAAPTCSPKWYDQARRPVYTAPAIREPYPPLTVVYTHNGSTRKNDTLKGIISHSSPISGSPNRHRYTVMITAEVWNASGRRETDRTETLNFYSDELTPILGEIVAIEL